MWNFANIYRSGALIGLVVLLSCSVMSLQASVTCVGMVVTPPSVVLPAVDVATIEQNLCLPYAGQTDDMCRFGASATYHARTIAVSNGNRSVSKTNGAVTPQMLRNAHRTSAGNGVGCGVSTSFRSSVSRLNEAGIAVMPQTVGNQTAIRRAGVPPNPDEDDEDLNNGDVENGPIGDALLPLLLMACLFACYRKRHLRMSHTPEN
ncbi:MAG TPA: hypothetical protein DIW30_01920 [Bacteroidales bacterium]|nr:hypothetical protein [Bacteroidales bacterium]